MAFPDLISTPGAADANAYADLATAVSYLQYRVGAAAWAGYSGELQAQALVSATRDIDTLEMRGAADTQVMAFPRFVGTRATETQALAWPRVSAGYPSTALPDRLVEATIELAYIYAQQMTADATLDVLNPDPSLRNIKREKVGPLETEYFTALAVDATAPDRLPPIVQRLLTPLLRAWVGVWGSGVATRGS